ncbi:MAG: hypothetical protein R2759_10950 [Bacteroidales bacterium]
MIVGGGPTGVELSGALAEMKKSVLPKDFPELDFQNADIPAGSCTQYSFGHVGGSLQNSPQIFTKTGCASSAECHGDRFEDGKIKIKDREPIQTDTVIWAAGVAGEGIDGLPDEIFNRAKRIIVDRQNRVVLSENFHHW